MYEVYSDGTCIHSDVTPLTNCKLISPKLVLQDNTAGTFTAILPQQNIGCGHVHRLTSEISILRDGREIWSGRIIDEQVDFWNRRHLTCEGELGYLNDTTQPPEEYHDYTVRQFLEVLIAEHNRKVAAEKRFTVGIVTVHDTNDSIHRYTNSESTFKCISDKLVDRLGGHVRVRKVDGVRYLDYLAEYPNTSTQEVRFGENLLDFAKDFDMLSLATVIMPRGNRLEESPIEALEAYLTVESVNGGSIYVTSEEAISKWGWIEQVVDWEDVSQPANLLRKAKEYLQDVQFEQMVLEVNAFDLHYMTKTTESIELLDLVRCVSSPHGMDRYFPVTKIEIPLDEPDNMLYTFGDVIPSSLTGNSKKINSKIIKKIDEMPSKSNILKSAKENAEAIINMATNGFITITKTDKGADELYISDTLDYKRANRYWRWNLNGLGYFKKGAGVKVAITMDGAIVADFITTGTMSADRIRAGILTDQKGNTTWNLNTGVLTMKKGSITLGTAEFQGGAFSVDDNGNMKAIRGVIGGFTIGSNSLSGPEMVLRNDTIVFRVSNSDNQFYGEIGPGGGALGSKGICIDILPKGNYFVVATSEASQVLGGTYNPILLYTKNRTYGEAAGYIHAYAPLDGHGHTANNFWINPRTGGASGGMSSTLNMIIPTGVDSEGKLTSWKTGCYITFTRGFCTGGSW